MKLPCTVMEDVLPIYMDGICADETEALVQEHLSQCPKCRQMLEKMQMDMQLQHEPDDMKPLQAIEKRWNQSKRLAFGKGAGIAVALLLVAAVILSGIWFISYGKYYYQMAQCMDPVPEEAVDMGSADRMKVVGGCRVGIWIPPILSNSGFVRITNESGMILFLYPQVGGGYSIRVLLRDNGGRTYGVWINPDLSINSEDHPVPGRTDWENTQILQLLQEQRDEIIAICDAANELWGIDLLEESR